MELKSEGNGDIEQESEKEKRAKEGRRRTGLHLQSEQTCTGKFH